MHNDLQLVQRFLEQELILWETAIIPNHKRIAEAKAALDACDRVVALLVLQGVN